MGQAKIRKATNTYYGQSGYVPPAVDPGRINSAYKSDYQNAFGKNFTPPASTLEERINSSYHEAGHAVAYVLGGFHVDFVTALPYFDEQLQAWAKGIAKVVEKNFQIEQFREYFVSKAAGCAADEIRERSAEHRHEMDKDQMERALTAMSMFPAKGIDRLFSDVVVTAKELLTQHWGAVEELAKLLQIEKRVEGSTVHEIVNRNRDKVCEVAA